MHRTLSFRGLQRLRVGIRHRQLLYRYQHEQVRPSNEILSKMVKPEEAAAPISTVSTEGSEDRLLKQQKSQSFAGDAGKTTAGEECWNSFYRKYQNRTLAFRDLVKLFRDVYAEAQYKKYQETPSTVYTLSCCGILPMASIGLFSLVTGGAFPALAYVQLTYSASILSFLGGVAWGHSITSQSLSFDKLAWAVAPPLLGWSAIMLPLPVGFAFTAVGLSASMVHDILLTSYPQWFKSLRYILTLVALVSLLPPFFMTALRS